MRVGSDAWNKREQRTAEVVRLSKVGYTVREIGHTLGIRESRVSAYRRGTEVAGSNAQAIRAERRRTQVLGMRQNGLLFREIGEALGVTRQRAHQLYRRAHA